MFKNKKILKFIKNKPSLIINKLINFKLKKHNVISDLDCSFNYKLIYILF